MHAPKMRFHSVHAFGYIIISSHSIVLFFLPLYFGENVAWPMAMF